MTWKLDLTNSCLLLARYGHVIFMDIITYIVPNLHQYLGTWFCYTSKVVMYYTNIYTAGHSMVVALLKFTLIVYWKKARSFGNAKIKEIFFWVNFCYPILMMLIHVMIKPDFFLIYDGYSRIDRCLGDPSKNLDMDGNRTQIKVHTICKMFVAPPEDEQIAYTFYVIRSAVCWMQVAFLYLAFWNFFEMICYCRIFAFMRK